MRGVTLPPPIRIAVRHSVSVVTTTARVLAARCCVTIALLTLPPCLADSDPPTRYILSVRRRAHIFHLEIEVTARHRYRLVGDVGGRAKHKSLRSIVHYHARKEHPLKVRRGAGASCVPHART